MLISIITPTFNSEKSIEQNVQSVISQTHHDFEHIIVDNQSSDKTLEIISTLYKSAGLEGKLKIISEKDEGISDAFNKGILAAKGDIIIILNSDDMFFDINILELASNAFNSADTLIVHGDIYFVDPVYGSNIRQPLKSPITGIVYNHPGMFIKREVYTKVGLYNTNFRYSMDYELYCRLKKEYKDTEKISNYINQPLVTMHAGGASWDNEVKSINEIKKALKLHNLWNSEALFYYLGRISRAELKKYLSLLGLKSLIKFWRNLKWKG